ncbi:MAG TPA: VOC family protein [Acidimicrobiales bacterium]|nr:VOC family protein [Acidimicrobiales bacterium]
MTTYTLAASSLDCSDPGPLADFWAALLGGEVAFSSEDFVGVKHARGWLAAIRVEGYEPPTWPGGDRPKQLHLDVSVDDLDVAQARAVELGATAPANQPQPDRWRVLLDPAGHPFCLTTQIPD